MSLSDPLMEIFNCICHQSKANKQTLSPNLKLNWHHFLNLTELIEIVIKNKLPNSSRLTSIVTILLILDRK